MNWQKKEVHVDWDGRGKGACAQPSADKRTLKVKGGQRAQTGKGAQHAQSFPPETGESGFWSLVNLVLSPRVLFGLAFLLCKTAMTLI